MCAVAPGTTIRLFAAVLVVGALAAGVTPSALAASEGPASEMGGLRYFPPQQQAGQTQAYQIAMASYEGRMLVAPRDIFPGFLIRPGQRFLWTWSGDAGQVQRIARDRFRLTGNDCLGHFCRQVSCFKISWPIFQCSDDKPRVLSAPDDDTVVFGEDTYTRVVSTP